MFDQYIKYAKENLRLPKELRTDKKLAAEYISFLKENKIDITNKDVFVLASWVKDDLDLYLKNKLHAKIKSIELLDEKQVVGDFTVPNGSSYTANGIIVHNCNLPNSATKELVSEIYFEAWKSGCKGFTIYRDGSRSGVLISQEEANKNKQKDGRPTDIQSIESPKRPKELPCDIKKVKVNGESWTIFIGLLNGKPYEIFGGLSKYVDVPTKYKMGKIVKGTKKSDGLSSYNLVIGDGDERFTINDIASIFENKTNEAFTRVISLSLRHGTPIHYVVDQLTKDKYADMTSFSKVISRVLKSYIKEDAVVSQDKKCEKCNNNTLVFAEGCLKCTVCSYSKC